MLPSQLVFQQREFISGVNRI
ncbi:Uncharacterized protein APZ42_029311 [Daphnia magna]|uniref:Uncharacterized protein n=1 Tax=Daphnia magna TaxID=35525 RepID=A0A164PTB8_9CRUS|nr:Uncharacterized protein APZ42_029311 [Daphnia magna]